MRQFLFWRYISAESKIDQKSTVDRDASRTAAVIHDGYRRLEGRDIERERKMPRPSINQ